MSDSFAVPEIAVLAKAPIPGLAKTRLIRRLGADGAARLQALLIEQAVRTACAAGLGAVTLWCTPGCQHPVFERLGGRTGLALRQQEGADLGERMAHAVSEHATRGPVLVTGTDCPALTPDHLRTAATVLADGADAVLFPAEDGGYVLIGLAAPQPALFDGVSWGTGRVMAETRRRLLSLGLRWSEPATLWDLDRPEDLDRLVRSGVKEPTDVFSALGGNQFINDVNYKTIV